MEIKVGDIVYLNSNPKIEMTVSHVDSNKVQAIYYNSINGKFEFTPSLPVQTITVVKK